MSNTILACEAVCKNYYDGQLNVQVLDNLTLQVDKGQSIGIVGASGSGKSTLLHILGGLDKPTSGRVSLMGQDLSQLSQKQLSGLRNQYLGFVYQFHHLLPEFSALENVMMPLLIGKRPKEQARERALLMLEKVGLKDRVLHRPGELSGGERQRAAIARALLPTRPACWPTSRPAPRPQKRPQHPRHDDGTEAGTRHRAGGGYPRRRNGRPFRPRIEHDRRRAVGLNRQAQAV